MRDAASDMLWWTLWRSKANVGMNKRCQSQTIRVGSGGFKLASHNVRRENSALRLRTSLSFTMFGCDIFRSDWTSRSCMHSSHE